MTMRAQFDRLISVYTHACEVGDARAVARLYTEDALLLNPGQPPVSGRQAIQEDYEKNLGSGYKLTVDVQDFNEQGDIAYAAGTYVSDNGSGKWLEVIKRQSDDSVLLHRVCTNSN